MNMSYTPMRQFNTLICSPPLLVKQLVAKAYVHQTFIHHARHAHMARTTVTAAIEDAFRVSGTVGIADRSGGDPRRRRAHYGSRRQSVVLSEAGSSSHLFSDIGCYVASTFARDKYTRPSLMVQRCMERQMNAGNIRFFHLPCRRDSPGVLLKGFADVLSSMTVG
ncbi:hypothetical protein BC835DRAFT_1535630 [Cytidiella melzeri]|nr:hypothetical protein BC835DRAFT_1535630 [Cytidiella melzeri]